jgi:hypothetical protein
MTFAKTAAIHLLSRSKAGLQHRSKHLDGGHQSRTGPGGDGHGGAEKHLVDGSGMAGWSVFGAIDCNPPCGMLSVHEALMKSARARRCR